MPYARDGDVVLLHRFQHGRLGFGRGAVDLVGKHDVGEDGAGLELELLLPARALDQNIGARDVGGHQVGRKLDAGELEIHGLRQRAHEQGLAQSRHAFQQGVSARQQADQHAVDDRLIADDHLSDLVFDALKIGCKLRGLPLDVAHVGSCG